MIRPLIRDDSRVTLGRNATYHRLPHVKACFGVMRSMPAYHQTYRYEYLPYRRVTLRRSIMTSPHVRTPFVALRQVILKRYVVIRKSLLIWNTWMVWVCVT